MKRIVLLLILFVFQTHIVYAYFDIYERDGITFGREGHSWLVISFYSTLGHQEYRITYSGEVIIPDSIPYLVENEAVVGIDIHDPSCFKDVTKLVLPNTIKQVKGIAGCKIETIDLPESLMYMINFNGCPNLREVIIPQSIKGIGEQSLANCPKLTHVHIGKNVNYISGSAFVGSGALASITVDPENPYFSDVNGVLYNKDKTELIYCPPMNSSGINELTTPIITIYPNPVDDVLYVKGAKEGETIRLIGLSGHTLRTVQATEEDSIIDTSDLPSGIYFCRVAERVVKVVKR